MGGVKKMWMEAEQLGIGCSIDKCVCAEHIDDYAIKHFIRGIAKDGVCDYCNEETPVIPVDDLMVLIMEGVNRVFKDAAEFMPFDSHEGGYQGETYSDEFMTDVIGLEIDNSQLQTDIESCISDKAWAKDYWDDYAAMLKTAWAGLKYIIKHKSRYMFSRTVQFKNDETGRPAYDILNQIGDIVRKYKLYSKLSAGVSLYRCRQHETSVILSKATDLASPPFEKAILPNRMSPAGIPMFYGAFDLDTAKSETVEPSDKSKGRVTSAVFKPKKDLDIIDFTRLPDLPSIFDAEKFKDYHPIEFLRGFVKDLSEAISRDGKEHIEYVPTQVMTEYFRFTFAEEQGLPIDGIVYPSSRIKGKNACVLFFDNRQSLDRLNFIAASVLTENV
jgi:hypothetical protein